MGRVVAAAFEVGGQQRVGEVQSVRMVAAGMLNIDTQISIVLWGLNVHKNS